jgi:hypothetical protein
MGLLDSLWGPSDSGDQEETQNEKSGGSGSTDYENSSIHYSDWNDSESHASWDEQGSDISGNHSTPKE